MDKRKILIILGINLFLVGGVTAAWLFTISTGFDMDVVSLPGYSKINLDIPRLSVNTTEGPDTDTAYVNFTINKDTLLNITIKETYQDNSGGECIGGKTDCETHYYITNNGYQLEINDSSQVRVDADRNPRSLIAEMNCVAYACPQSRVIDIDLVESA